MNRYYFGLGRQSRRISCSRSTIQIFLGGIFGFDLAPKKMRETDDPFPSTPDCNISRFDDKLDCRRGTVTIRRDGVLLSITPEQPQLRTVIAYAAMERSSQENIIELVGKRGNCAGQGGLHVRRLSLVRS